MFEFLFKYPVSTWRNAELVWLSGWPLSALLVCALIAVALVWLTLLRHKLGPAKRTGLGVLQFIALLIGLGMLWQPALRTESVQAGENTVAYLLDTSASMLTSDVNDNSRLQSASELLESSIEQSDSLFDSSIYHVGDELALQAEPVSYDNVALLDTDERSAIADGVLQVLESVNDQALAAVVLLSDGADNVSELSSDWWQAVKAAGVPVHTVGFGQTKVLDDIELSNITMDSQAGVNSIVTARLQLLHNGFESVRVRVTSGDQLVHAETLELDNALDQSVHTIEFNSGEAGVRDLRFSVSANDTNAESNLTNNVQTRVLNVSDQSKRVLYVEGEPRWEYKFIRRALHNFGGVSIVSLLRTSPNKFYRQGVSNAQELVDGFPKTRDALYAYDAVVIGSLEAAELSTEQQAFLRDFVSERGGSLLMLAGNQGLSDGGWGRSAVAAALPVKLNSSSNARDFERVRVSVRPTTQGMRTGWLRLDDDDDENLRAWSELPQVNDIQTLGAVKPGSTTLLAASHNTQSQPLLVWHRYGQGQSFVLGTSGTWRWQMRLPSENQWHERFWQQLLSHLVAGSLPQLSLDNAQAVYRDSNDIPVEVTVRSADFQPLSDTTLTVNVTAPSGRVFSTSLNADIDKPGRFLGSFEATEDGPYAVSLTAPVSGESPAAFTDRSIDRWLIKESGTAEQFDARQHNELLQRISAATGGQYLDASDQDQLAEILSLKNAGLTRENVLPLWNMPIAFLLLLLAKALEWFLRLRWKRL